MTLVEGFEAQAEQVFRNLFAVLAEAGMDSRNVAKLTTIEVEAVAVETNHV